MNNSVQIQQVMTLAVEVMIISAVMSVLGAVALGAASTVGSAGVSRLIGTGDER